MSEDKKILKKSIRIISMDSEGRMLPEPDVFIEISELFDIFIQELSNNYFRNYKRGKKRCLKCGAKTSQPERIMDNTQ